MMEELITREANNRLINEAKMDQNELKRRQNDIKNYKKEAKIHR